MTLNVDRAILDVPCGADKLAALRANPDCPMLPLLDHRGRQPLPFGEFEESVKQRVEISRAADEPYVGLGHASVLGAGEVDPGQLDEPSGVDMGGYRSAVADLLLQDALLTAAEANQVMHLNPNAALQRAIFAAGFVPNSPELRLSFEGETYAVQRAEHLGTGQVRAYYVPVGHLDQVKFVRRT